MIDILVDAVLLGDRVLVRKLCARNQGQVALVQNDPHSIDAVEGDYRRKFLYGEIVAVGPGRWVDGEFQATDVKPGMKIYFGDWNDCPELGEDLALITEPDIGAVVT